MTALLALVALAMKQWNYALAKFVPNFIQNNVARYDAPFPASQAMFNIAQAVSDISRVRSACEKSWFD